jgi:hypothetical protein
MTDLDPLLRDAMARVRGPVNARPSLTDVRRRARRHNRRRMAATAGLVACTGVATAAVIIRRDSIDPVASSQSEPLDGGATSTVYEPGVFGSTTTMYGLPTMTVTASAVWDALWNARYDPAGAALVVEPADPADTSEMPTPDQFGCTSDECRAMFNYVVWHEIAKELGFPDVRSMQDANPNIDFSVPPVDGDVLQTISSIVDGPTTSMEVIPTSTILCDQSGSGSTVVVANASNENGVAKSWSQMLKADVPSAVFADAVNAIAPEPRSRVLALEGHECEASSIAYYTTGGAFEVATAGGLQSLVSQPLPAGTSIVVLIGDEHATTTTSTSSTTTTTMAPTTIEATTISPGP